MTPILTDPALAPAKLTPPPDHLSFSQLRALSTRYARSCPRKWAYERILNIETPDRPGPALLCGKIVDEAVTALLQARMMGWSENTQGMMMTKSVEDNLELWAPSFPQGKAEAYARIIMEGAAALRTFLVDVAPVTVQEEHVWHLRGADKREITMVGYSDWVESDGTIVDLKWRGSPPWNRLGEWDQSYLSAIYDQLSVYYVGRMAAAKKVELSAVPPARGRVVVLSHALNRITPVVRQYDFEITPAMVRDVMDVVREADAAQHAETHPARPGPQCERCDFLERCRTDSAVWAPATSRL
jgi:hypothetical protein